MAPKAKKGAKAEAKPAAKEEKKEENKEEAAGKRKAEETAEGEAPAKEAKVEEKKEKEEDAKADKRPTIKESLGFNATDLTLNAVPTMGDKLLTAFNDGGLQHFIAGARANVGIKAGRYMFEMRILEVLTPEDFPGNRRPPQPKQLMRIGFSTADSPVVLGSGDMSVCFDAEGQFYAGKTKKTCAQRFNRDQVIAVVLNLDPDSPNKNTLSLFRDGVRIAEPQAIPEALHGKTLYPHVAFRNVTVEMLFGKTPEKELPFTCKTVAGAAKDDAVINQKKVAENKVVFPVGVPNHGLFEWLAEFMEKNPDYVELSDRKLIEWAEASGMWKQGGKWGGSLDKPHFYYGIPNMEDFSVQRIISNVAPLVPRNYVVMEEKANLVVEERKKALNRFSAPCFKKVAHVAMGEPDAAFRKKQLDAMLAEKQAKEDAAWNAKKQEIERKKQLKELRERQAAERKKKQEELAAKAAEAKAKREADAKAKAEAKKAENGDKKMEVDAEGEKKEGEKKDEDKKEEKVEEKKEDEKKEENKEEEKKEEKEEEKKEDEKKEEKKEDAKKEEENKEEETKEEDKKDEPAEEELPAEPKKAELTDEEQKLWFKPSKGYEMADKVVDRCFASFSVPEKSEGFAEIVYDWQTEAKAKEYFRAWLLEKKRTSKIEDLVPSPWFIEKLKAMQQTLKEYMALAEKKTEAKKGDDDAGEKEIAEVEDVKDVGNGEPLFKTFAFEDWALVQLRFELFLLTKGFEKDVNDPDRTGIPEDHLGFYYNKYFHKSFTPSHFGLTDLKALLNLAKDTVKLSEDKILSTPLSEESDMGAFVKLAEEGRRERQRRIDAGDETARIKFQTQAMTAATVPDGKAHRGGGKWRSGPYDGGNKGKGGGKGSWGQKRW